MNFIKDPERNTCRNVPKLQTQIDGQKIVWRFLTKQVGLDKILKRKILNIKILNIKGYSLAICSEGISGRLL